MESGEKRSLVESTERYTREDSETRVTPKREVPEDSIEARVIEIVAEQLGVSRDQVTPETSFINDLGADSLDTVELVMELEEKFDISIPDDAADKIQTVGQVIDYIKKLKSTS